MSSELVEIQPPILKFTFELRKQTQCLIQLANKSDQFVAFKVKTTSPKKYVVKPNIRVIKPKGSSDFTVIMLAQSVAPPDLLCKDKFLVQSTIVPFGLTEENVTSEMFVKDPSKRIEERKLKVLLVAPVNPTETPDDSQEDRAPTETESHHPYKDGEGSQSDKVTEETPFTKVGEPRPDEVINESSMARSLESREVKKLEEEKVPNVAGDLKSEMETEDMSLKINGLGSKIAAAEQIAAQLMEERNRICHEKELIEQELAMARRKNVVKKVYMGYPLPYVCLVSLFSLTFGYLLRQ